MKDKHGQTKRNCCHCKYWGNDWCSVKRKVTKFWDNCEEFKFEQLIYYNYTDCKHMVAWYEGYHCTKYGHDFLDFVGYVPICSECYSFEIMEDL